MANNGFMTTAQAAEKAADWASSKIDSAIENALPFDSRSQGQGQDGQSIGDEFMKNAGEARDDFMKDVREALGIGKDKEVKAEKTESKSKDYEMER